MNGAKEAPVLTAHGLSFGYRARVICDRVGLELYPGQIIGIYGPSGCGKSTLLRLLSGQEAADDGDLDLGGQAVLRAGRRVGTGPRPGYVMPVLQDPIGALDPRWPVWRSLTEPLTAPGVRYDPERRLTRRARRDLAGRALARAGLGNLDPAARPGELSTGQCQRLTVLRALLARPAVLLADEPTSALDLTTAAGVLHLLADAARVGAGVIVVSHDRPLLGTLTGDVRDYAALGHVPA